MARRKNRRPRIITDVNRVDDFKPQFNKGMKHPSTSGMKSPYKTGYKQQKQAESGIKRKEYTNAMDGEVEKNIHRDTFKKNFPEIASQYTDAQIDMMNDTGVLDYLFDSMYYEDAVDMMVDYDAQIKKRLKDAEGWTRKQEFTQKDLDRLFHADEWKNDRVKE